MLSRHLILLLLILLLTHSAYSSSLVERCPFSGQIYYTGDTWHPHVETTGAAVCATCTCHAGGKYQCTSKECIPSTCPDPSREPGQCCANCVEIQPNLEATNINGRPYSCLHQGKIYRDGQIFVTNASVELVQRLPADQCLQCNCKNGTVICDVPVCQPLDCENQMWLPSRCCPMCQGQVTHCNSGGQSYAHGVIWYMHLGLADNGCEECTCNYGQVVCNPLRCPSSPNRRSCSALRRLSIPDTCCPSCPKNRKKKDGNNRKGRKRKNQLQGDTGVDTRDPTVLCLPKRTNIAMYKSQASSNNSGYVQYLFIFANKESAQMTELHTWTLTQGKAKRRISDFKIQYLTKDNTEILKKTFQFQLMGATNSRLLQKFRSREERLKSKCNSRCSRKVNRLTNALKLKEIFRSKQCTSVQTHLV